MLSIEQKIKNKALELGFDAVGISSAEKLSKEKKILEQWINKGYNGRLSYMERNIEKRENPSLLFENTQSILSVLLNYYPNDQCKTDSYQISKYAYGTDYHFVIKDRLMQLANYIQEEHFEHAQMRPFVDSAPVFDKAWASKSGLGWIGKNSMLIHKKLGSFVFVGELFIDQKLEADKPFEANYCGNCTACIDACPTHAIVRPGEIDARKCISYHTIESKDDIPESVLIGMKSEIFGCDICQDVCPWNRKAKEHQIAEFNRNKVISQWGKTDWEKMTKADFKEHFKSSPLFRTGYKKVMKTIEQLKQR
jgi:epoxyqueuosine reductase